MVPRNSNNYLVNICVPGHYATISPCFSFGGRNAFYRGQKLARISDVSADNILCAKTRPGGVQRNHERKQRTKKECHSICGVYRYKKKLCYIEHRLVASGRQNRVETANCLGAVHIYICSTAPLDFLPLGNVIWHRPPASYSRGLTTCLPCVRRG